MFNCNSFNFRGLLVFVSIIFFGVNSNIVNVCPKKGCHQTADIFNAVMDKTVDPCDNFYKYACGKFGEYTANKHETHEVYSWTSLLTDDITQQVKEFILSDRVKKFELRAGKKAHDFYKLCIDTDSMDDKGLEPVRQLLEKVGLPTSFPFKKTRNFNWVETAAKLKKYLDYDFLFAVDVTTGDADSSDEKLVTMTLNPPEIALPFLGKTSYPAKRLDNSKLKTYAKAVFEQMSENVNKPKTKRERKIIEKSVNSLIEFSASRQDLLKSEYSGFTNKYKNKKKSIGELQKFTDIVTKCSSVNKNTSTILWKDFFASLFADFENIEVKFDQDNIILLNKGNETENEIKRIGKITIGDGIYLRKLITFLTTKKIEEIQLAMWFDTVTKYIELTTYTMRHLQQDFTKEDYSTETWTTECYNFVKNFFSLAVLQHMVGEKESIETKKEVKEFVEDYKYALAHIIEKSDWIDSTTKTAALEKIKKMKSQVSHPDWLLNDTAMNKYYDKVEIFENDFFKTVNKLEQNSVKKKLHALLGIGVNEEEEDATFSNDNVEDILTVNAFYEPDRNTIVIPMGILRIPNYGYPIRSLNYGAIGATVGHEITHGFDNDGITYDADGDEAEWWQASTLENYKKRAECFIDSYNSIDINNVTFDGEQTLAENLADNGGLRQSILAYRHWVQEEKGQELTLPGFENLTSEQLLFLGYAISWCEYLPDSELDIYEDDVHSPPELRVLGPLINSEEFAEVWKCPKGSRMNPNKEKCRLW